MAYNPIPEKGTPLDSAIEETAVLAARYPDNAYIVHVGTLLTRTQAELSDDRITGPQACQLLFDIYFEFEPEVRDAPPLPGILRVVGDDLGRQLGIDSDVLWGLYQNSLNNAE